MTITLPEQQPGATPLPWVLLQVNGNSLLVGRRERLPAVLARVALEADALRIFRAVHAHEPMLTALRLVKARLYTDGGYAGAPRLSASFNHQDYLLLTRALALAESEAGP